MNGHVKVVRFYDVELRLLNSLIRYQINRLEEELEKPNLAEEQRQMADDLDVYKGLLTKVHIAQ